MLLIDPKTDDFFGDRGPIFILFLSDDPWSVGSAGSSTSFGA